MICAFRATFFVRIVVINIPMPIKVDARVIYRYLMSDDLVTSMFELRTVHGCACAIEFALPLFHLTRVHNASQTWPAYIP